MDRTVRLQVHSCPFGRHPLQGETVLLNGADGFLAKPVTIPAAFEAAILRHLPKPRLVRSDSAQPSSLATAPPG